MFLQRLIADEDIGFNYDYMGSAEFEFGATGKSREILARLLHTSTLSARKVRFFVRWGRSTIGPVDVVVFGTEKDMADLGINGMSAKGLPYDLLLTGDKENPRIDNAKYLGWMSVLTESPILIIRDHPTNLERGTKFLYHFIEQMKQAGQL